MKSSKTLCMLLLGSSMAVGEVDSLLDRSHWVWWDTDAHGYYRDQGTDQAIIDCVRDVFTFTRDIESPAAVKQATMWVSAQNIYTFSINGKEVGRDNNWMSLERYDLKPFLAEGRNRFEIKATYGAEYAGMKAMDAWWVPGLFFAGRVETADGKTQEILADETWDCANAKGMTKKAEIIIQGVDGGYWNNCNRVFEMPELWYRLNTELVAPHIAWAKPRLGGKVKMLVVLERHRQRDIVELIHRADIDVECVFTDICEADARYGGTRAPFFPETKGARKDEVTAALTEALKGSPDVILLLGCREDVFHEVAADRLKAMVQGGVGLIYATIPPKSVEVDGKKQNDTSFEKELTSQKVDEQPNLLAAGVPFEKLPWFRLDPKDKEKSFQKVATLYSFGQGRIMRLQLAPSLSTVPDPSDLNYEYCQSFLIKSILWAARKEPAVEFKNFPAGLTADRVKPGELTFELTETGTYTAQLSIRSPERLFAVPPEPLADQGLRRGEAVLRPIQEAAAQAKAGGIVKLRLPSLPAGQYFADVVIRDGDKKVNWATASLTVGSSPAISELAMMSPTIDVAEGKAAAVQVRATLSEGAPKKTAVGFSLVDNYDRVVDAQEVDADPGEVQVQAVFLVKTFRTCLGRVRAELRADGQVLDVKVARFTALRRDTDRFGLFGTYGGWGGSHEGNVKARIMGLLGFDAGFTNVSFDTLEGADLLPIPGTFGINPRGKIDLDPAGLEQRRRTMRKGMQSVAPFDPVAYVCGDELDYGGGEELPSRVIDYRDALKKKHKTIEALNKQWGTEHKSFDDVYPLISDGAIKALKDKWDSEVKKGVTPAGIDPSKYVSAEEYKKMAEETGNYSQHIDLWRNNYRVFADEYRLATEMAKESNPHARIGTWAPMWPFAYTGHDWATFVRDMGCFVPYGREGEMLPMESCRSFAPPTTLTGLCYGGYLYMGFPRQTQLKDLEWQKWRIWSGLFRRFTSVWWYSMGHGNESGMSPGYLPYPCLQVAADEAARMQRGPYHIFTRATRNYGPIAMHYSIPSTLLSALISDFNDQTWDAHFLLRILQDYVGHQYTQVSNEQIMKGELGKYRVLIMPLSMAIDDEEATAMRKFVESGGLLIADVRPGFANGHGNVNENKFTCDLFGISYKMGLGRKMLVGELSGEYKGVAFKNDKRKVPADLALELKGAKAVVEIDGVPLITCRDLGKGSAVCLNVPFNYYRGYPTPDHLYKYFGEPNHNRMLGRVIRAILKAHKIDPPVEVTTPDGEWLWGLDVPYHVDGDAQYVSITKRRSSKYEQGGYEVTLRPPKGGHIHDISSGKYLGQKESFPVQVVPADVQLYSVLPYRVTGLKVELARKAVRRGEEINGAVAIEGASDKPVRHFIHIEVTRPDGQEMRYLAQTLEAPKGQVRFSLPIALNEPKGRYTVHFTDAATQVKATSAVTVD